jgi:hypothetical protein
LRLGAFPAVIVEKRRSQGPGRLRLGTYPEIELHARNIGWKGKVDLLILSDDVCEISDFKTGAQGEGHRFQIQVYSLLWSRDEELNPDRRRANRLVLRYHGEDVEVAAPTPAQLEELERDIVVRRDAAGQAVTQRPPQAHPTEENCRFCGVRQLCDKYWATSALGNPASLADLHSADVELTITGKHGPSSWDSVVEFSPYLESGRLAVLRTKGDIEFRLGDRLRVLNVGATVDSQDEEQPVVFTLGTAGEVYFVT